MPNCARAHIDSILESYVDVALPLILTAQMGRLEAFTVASVVATLLPVVCADLAQTYPMSEVLDWEIESQMQLSLTSDGDIIPILYTVIPLTADLGLNESQTDRGVIQTPCFFNPHHIAPSLPYTYRACG